MILYFRLAFIPGVPLGIFRQGLTLRTRGLKYGFQGIAKNLRQTSFSPSDGLACSDRGLQPPLALPWCHRCVILAKLCTNLCQHLYYIEPDSPIVPYSKVGAYLLESLEGGGLRRSTALKSKIFSRIAMDLKIGR